MGFAYYRSRLCNGKGGILAILFSSTILTLHLMVVYHRLSLFVPPDESDSIILLLNNHSSLKETTTHGTVFDYSSDSANTDSAVSRAVVDANTSKGEEDAIHHGDGEKAIMGIHVTNIINNSIEGKISSTVPPDNEGASTEKPFKSCLTPHGPQPYILMTLGRSGSASTSQILGNLSGKETPMEEFTGSSLNTSRHFFQHIENLTEKNVFSHPGQWLVYIMCMKQNWHKDDGTRLVGFRWKPYVSIYSPPSIAGLKLIAKLAKTNEHPPIKIVRSRRNLLDVFISRTKHRTTATGLRAHCVAGDKSCVESHVAAGKGVILSVSKLLSTLRSMNDAENKVDQLLLDLEVPHIVVTYERLYFGTDANEWNRIFDFLGIEYPTGGFQTSDVEKAMSHVYTSNVHHEETIGNFNEVRHLLKDTEFESLLHP